VVAALRSVDAVTLLDDIRPIHLIERWRPDVYIKGGDYSQSQLRSGAAVEAYGGRVAVCPVAFDVSTTRLVERAAHASLYSTPSSVPRESQPLILLDRDGTLIRNVPFLRDPKQVALLPGVGEGLAALQEQGFRLALLTNQQGLGLGYFDYPEFVAVNQEMLRQLAPFGVRISKIYYCPHSVADQCSCRKPGTELIRHALQDFDVQPSACYVIGDSPSDRQAAIAAGCHAVLVAENGASFLHAVRQVGDSWRAKSVFIGASDA
jgi:D-glycero-D-manno-heptose 1,7-bisphosphate phosphatase